MQTETRLGGQGRAALYLAGVNLKIIKAAADRHQRRQGTAPGARLPGSLAGAPVELRVLSEPRQGGKSDPVTPLGYKTAVRSLPRLLSGLSDADPRRRAALMLADAVERVGAIKGMDLGGTDISGGVSDGGATTKVKHAARLKLVEALANGWEVKRGGKIIAAAPRVLMPVQRRNGKRMEIRAFPALIGVCVEGHSVDEILRRHGWFIHSKPRGDLGAAILATLDDVAEGLGLGRWNAKKA